MRSWFPGSCVSLLALLAMLAGCDGAAPTPAVAPLDATVRAPADAALDASARSPELDASRVLDDAAQADGTADASPPAAEPLRWETVVNTLDDGEILIEKVSYLSEGLRVYGQVCRPNPAGKHGPGPFPVSISNHGGFSGITDWNGGNCADTARRGWVVAESSYRGEDGSDGQIEVCLGEVTDVMRLLEVVRAEPYADPTHVAMSGISHGGCITLRALERGAPVQLAIDIFGPTDWASAYADWQNALAAGTSAASTGQQQLVSALEQATGGSPDAFPDEYAKRSPLHFIADLERVAAPLLVVQGTADAYVFPSQPCSLADASSGFARYHVGVLGTVSTSAPDGCTGASASWQPGPRPTTSWPADRYLIVYDGVGHNYEGIATSYLIADMTAFLTARFPP